MPLDSTQLNLLGTKLYIFASILLSEAAELQAAQKNLENNNLKTTLSDKADRLNISGNWLVLLSDIILGAATYADILENPDVPINEVTRLNLITAWLSILTDILSLVATIEAANS